ncbi:uncharacterized protein EI97DRAFT_277324 [Westerdykella ornata]|uniref:White collar-2 n=1 Tax=Westerdykella ornata TaxID=318751 RepID=A0A6A6JN15_WESOR|nr:uncharacterized protein EI97DRAFT_277324 [Westerdykella ornata]KAF2277892.1 hypothetical protein EI97DRAFT_277324 [Westerdykella ornata]
MDSLTSVPQTQAPPNLGAIADRPPDGVVPPFTAEMDLGIESGHNNTGPVSGAQASFPLYASNPPMSTLPYDMTAMTSSAGAPSGVPFTLGPDTGLQGIRAEPHTSNPRSSTVMLSEFTKRRHWQRDVLQEMRDLLHVLKPDGEILYVSPSCKTLTGWEDSQLVGRIVNDFIHPDDAALYVQEFTDAKKSGNPLRFFYRFKKADESWAIFELHGHPLLTTNPTAPFGQQPALRCTGFFMMSRPYPTKNAELLDSFLEHKIENERLLRRIAELKKEEQEELEAEDSQWRSQADTYSSLAPSEPHESTATPAHNAMPPPAKPAMSNTALTRQNLDEASVTSKPDSIDDKMARYEGTSHIETIEMLTGLHYGDGERSKGISTGAASPVLIRGDVGIQYSVDRDTKSLPDKKKKVKRTAEYVCRECGVLQSPEWRKGPSGPKTLCNACGLRWSKEKKKMEGGNQEAGQGQSQSQSQGKRQNKEQNNKDSRN